jgi:hypothetical protein
MNDHKKNINNDMINIYFLTNHLPCINVCNDDIGCYYDEEAADGEGACMDKHSSCEGYNTEESCLHSDNGFSGSTGD